MFNKYFKHKIIDVSKLEELIKIFPDIKNFIDLNQPFYFRIMPDHFSCIVHTIISQQISNAAVNTIWNKLVSKIKKITPKNILSLPLEELRLIGFSNNKIKSLKQISNDIIIKKLNLKKLKKMSDQKIYEILSSYDGIGKWSIDMIMIFNYYRNNIISYSDFGIRNGIKILFKVNEITESTINMINSTFDQNLTLLSLILWKISNERDTNKKAIN